MATFTFYPDFVEQVGKEQHQLSTDTLKWSLSNSTNTTATTATVFSDITEIATGNGYTGGSTGGVVFSGTYVESGGTATLNMGTATGWTASGGSIADFRYAYLWNDSNGTDMLIGYIDHGSTVSLATGQSYVINTGDVFTVTTA